MAKRQSVTQRYREALEEIAGAILPVKPVIQPDRAVIEKWLKERVAHYLYESRLTEKDVDHQREGWPDVLAMRRRTGDSALRVLRAELAAMRAQPDGVEITEMLVPLKNAEYLRTVARVALEKK